MTAEKRWMWAKVCIANSVMTMKQALYSTPYIQLTSVAIMSTKTSCVFEQQTLLYHDRGRVIMELYCLKVTHIKRSCMRICSFMTELVWGQWHARLLCDSCGSMACLSLMLAVWYLGLNHEGEKTDMERNNDLCLAQNNQSVQF